MNLSRSLPTLLVGVGLLALSTTAGAVAGTVITGAQIQDGTVKSVDVKNKTLKVKDLSPKARASLRGNTGPTGPTGPAGPQGLQGIQGNPGPLASGYKVVTTLSQPRPDNSAGVGEAWCPRGLKALGGGASWLGGPLGATTTTGRSFPALAIRDADGNVTGSEAATPDLADGWIGEGWNHDGANRTFGVWVICAQTA
jgi:hypothetical protein